MRLLDLFENDMFLEDLEGQKAQRGQWIKDKLGAEFQKRAIPGYGKNAEGLERLIDKIGEVDPTQNGTYMPWLARMVIKDPNQNKPEDLDRVGDDLVNFERLKPRLAKRDINQYKSFEEVYDAISPLLRAGPSEEELEKERKREREREVDDEMRSQIIYVYEGPEGWIKIPTTEQASCWLGRNTRWCNAAKKNNQFNRYNKDDRLFVIYDRKLGERMQLHLDSHQLADEEDHQLKYDRLPEWARKIIVKWYKDNVSPQDLGLKQVVNMLTDLGADDIANGTAHEDLAKLYKEYFG